jgi:hypothetical protein
MNPYLEKALTKYYGRRRRAMLILTLASAAICLLTILYVLVAKPEGGLFSDATALFGAPSAFGVVFGLLFWRAERPALLEVFRERPNDVRSLRRGQVTYRARRGLIKVEKEVSTIFVALSDGRELPLYFPGDLDEFNRLQKMIEKVIDDQRMTSS